MELQEVPCDPNQHPVWMKSFSEAPAEQRRADRDTFLQRLRQCRQRAVQVLSGLGQELAQELEAGLFLQLDDTWTMDCTKEDVEDTLHVRRCKGCMCFASRWMTPGLTNCTAEHAQQILEGFPKPPPTAPTAPTATAMTERVAVTEAIEEFPEGPRGGRTAKPAAGRKRAGGAAPKTRGKRKKQSQSFVASKSLDDVPRQLSEQGGSVQKNEAFLWSAGLEESKQMKQITRDEKDEKHEKISQVPVPAQVQNVEDRQDRNFGMQSPGRVVCMHPQKSLPPQHGSGSGCDGNLWMQPQGCMPCMQPQNSLPPQHASSSGCDEHLGMQSQGRMPCMHLDGSLPPQHGSGNGCDGNPGAQFTGCAPYMPPFDSLPPQSNESGCGGNLWMRPSGMQSLYPQGSVKSPTNQQKIHPPVVEGHSKCASRVEGNVWMHVGNAHPPSTPDPSTSRADMEDDNFASAGSLAPDASNVPLPCLLPKPAPNVDKVASEPSVQEPAKDDLPPNTAPPTPKASKALAPTTPPPRRGSVPKASPAPAARRLTNGVEVLAEIARILSVVEPVPHSNAAARRWAYEVLRLESDAAPNAASKAYRMIAREIHPDGRAKLLEEEELRCHEALAKLQRARRLVAAMPGPKRGAAVRRPERMRVEVRNGAWWITWQQREQSGVRYELRAQDGPFVITVGDLDPSIQAKRSADEVGFEVRMERLSRRLQEVLRSNGWLGVRVAALAGEAQALSDEATLWLRELTEAKPTLSRLF